MYKTQMEAAKKGILTKEMKSIAESEAMDEKILMQRVASGEIAIPANKNHSSLVAKGVGTGLSTKINVNLGISKDCPDVDKELEKVKVAIDMKADAIMDLSSFGKTEEFRKKLIAMSTAMIGTVPVYDAIGFYDKELKDIKAEEFLDVVRKHAEDGVDFVTIHAGLNREAVELFKRNERITNIVSRGGSLMYAWMELNNAENPFYENFDKLLDICEEYDIDAIFFLMGRRFMLSRQGGTQTELRFKQDGIWTPDAYSAKAEKARKRKGKKGKKKKNNGELWASNGQGGWTK